MYHPPTTIYHLPLSVGSSSDAMRCDPIRSLDMPIMSLMALVYGTYASSPLIQSIAHQQPRPVIIISCKQLRSLDKLCHTTLAPALLLMEDSGPIPLSHSTRGEHVSAHHRSYERLWCDLVLSYCHTGIRFTRVSDVGHSVLAEVGYRSCITHHPFTIDHPPSTTDHLQCVAAPISSDAIRCDAMQCDQI